MFPIYHATVTDRLRERLAEASDDRLARQVGGLPAVGVGPSPVRRARSALGVALVRAGQAILPVDDRGRTDRPRAAA
jgi:hypothetical protein